MPIRFRRSFKIAPGIRLNLSKSGTSMTLGKRGASVNVGKRGVRGTVGIPGTGISYTTGSAAPKASGGHGCLYYLFIWPFVITIQTLLYLGKAAFHIITKLWEFATATPERKRATLITGGVVLLVGCLFTLATIALDAVGIIDRSTPEPTLDLVAINMTAFAIAWQPATQTAAALPTITPTETPSPTETSIPTETFTSLPTFTFTLPPTTAILYIQPTQPPSASQCICTYDAYNCDDALAAFCFNYCNSQGYGDIHRLDGDNDGSVCE
ncbi:MAG: DUF4236 domain-containing protein [Chloroflexota bacterium]